jgi:hypothetical protein
MNKSGTFSSVDSFKNAVLERECERYFAQV